MEPEQVIPTDATLVTPPTPVPATGDTVNWQDKWNGLNGAFKQEKLAKEAALIALHELRTKYEGETASLKTEKETATAEAALLKAEAETARAEAATLKAERETRKLVASKSPLLAEKFDKGFLRVEGLEGDALTTYLDEYLADLEGTRREAVKDTVSGRVPTPSGGSANASMTSEQMFAKLMAMSPSNPEYAALESAYYDADTKGK